MKTKTYDALAEVRRVRDELSAEMENMTPAERIACIKREAEAFRRERSEDRSQTTQ
jgi:hypothetical protein